MKIIIIIPTFNEEGSIGNLLDEIVSETSKITNHNIGLLIVDGKSKDNTIKIVTAKKNQHRNINFIIETEKKGLGGAYIEAMNHALYVLQADAVMEFDGDSQHDPKDIYKLVEKLDEGFEHIIGSRYIPGGTIPKTWKLWRKFLSFFGNKIAKVGLSLPTKDSTSGFKLTLLSKFKNDLPLSSDKILSLRHAYKIHLLHDLIALGAKTTEVPINFLDRNKGISKSTLEDISESLKIIFILRYRKIRNAFIVKNKLRINKKTTDRN